MKTKKSARRAQGCDLPLAPDAQNHDGAGCESPNFEGGTCTPMPPWVRDCSVGPSPPGLPVIVDRTGGASGSIMMLSTLEIGGKGETRGTCDVQCAGSHSVALRPGHLPVTQQWQWASPVAECGPGPWLIAARLVRTRAANLNPRVDPRGPHFSGQITMGPLAPGLWAQRATHPRPCPTSVTYPGPP